MRLKLLYESEEIDFGIVDDDKNITDRDVDKILRDLRNPDNLPIIKIIPILAYHYSKDVIKGRWPEGEEVIKKDPIWAYEYSLNIVKGRWPEGEKAIKKNPGWAYYYSRNVIKGRWPEGEEVIKKDPIWAYEYSLNIVKGRWKEVEEVIKKDPGWAYYYSRNVIKGRWPEGEEAIKKSKYWKLYKKSFKITESRIVESEEIDFGIVDDDKNITEKDILNIIDSMFTRDKNFENRINTHPKLAYYYSKKCY
jgi:hypothetical protein